MPNHEDYLNYVQAAKILGVSYPTIVNWVRTEVLETCEIAGRRVIIASSLPAVEKVSAKRYKLTFPNAQA